ncbi:unnamed protein product [Scytosiphon promiscuus]
MKTAFAAASTLAMANSAAAFVTPNAVRAVSPSTAARSSSLSMEFAGGLRGADGPEPNSKNFDPLGLSEARPENLLFFREAEIKVCKDFVRVPGDIFQNVSVLDAHNVMVEKGPMWQLLFWISFAEIILFPTVIDMDKKDREPGDFALDPLNLCKTPEKAEKYKLSELKNGRLAMMAVSGALTQMGMTGHGFPFLG